MNINNAVLGGNLTRDVELKYTQSNMAIGTFGIANNRKFTTASGEKREDVLFIDCTAWGKTAEILSQYFKKGKPICVVGRLRLETWQDKNDGSKRSKISLTVDSFSFAGGKGEHEAGSEPDDGYAVDPAPARAPKAQPNQTETLHGDPPKQPRTPAPAIIDEDEIPF